MSLGSIHCHEDLLPATKPPRRDAAAGARAPRRLQAHPAVPGDGLAHQADLRRRHPDHPGHQCFHARGHAVGRQTDRRYRSRQHRLPGAGLGAC